MNAQQLAEQADMIVSGYGFFKKNDYIEVIDLNNTENRLIIQNDEVVESLMNDDEEDIVLEYYLRNKIIMEESTDAQILSI